MRKLFKCAPILKQADPDNILGQQLTAIFGKVIPKVKAEEYIRACVKRVTASGLSGFDKFVKMFAGWWAEITNYYIDRANSGFVEGLNNNLKVLKRRRYGIFDRKHLLQRIFLDLEGYHLFAWQPPDVA